MVRRSERLAKKVKAVKPTALQKQKDTVIKLRAELRKTKAQLSAGKVKTLHALKVANDCSKTLIERTGLYIRLAESKTEVLNKLSETYENWAKDMDRLRTVTQDAKLYHTLMLQYRQRVQDVTNQHTMEEVRANGGPLPWQLCEICLEKYNNEEAHTPRMLLCGHTFCLECCEKLVDRDRVTCPFCRKISVFGGSLDAFPKNFALLNICS